MTAVNKFDRGTVKSVMSDVEKNLAGLLKSYGLSATYRARFDTERCTVRIELVPTNVDKTGKVIDQVCVDYDKMQQMSGILPKRGTKLNYLGEEFEIYGYKMKARKIPILVRKLADGRLYKMSIHNVASALNSMELMKKAAKR